MHIAMDNAKPEKAQVSAHRGAAAAAYAQNIGDTKRTLKAPKSGAVKSAEFAGTAPDGQAYGLVSSLGLEGGSTQEIAQSAANIDVERVRDWLTVMASSMSDEDFARMQAEGYDPARMDVGEAVTILDHIKVAVMKSGVDVAGYTDTIDMDKLAEITGSPTLARKLVEAFAYEDIPATDDNINQTMEAYAKGKELDPMTDGAVKFMVTNSMEPEIDNLYVAQHAGANDADRQGSGYFRDELGYYVEKAQNTDEEMGELAGQVGAIIKSAGFEVDSQTLADGFWLVDKGIPLTRESFALVERLKSVILPAPDDILFRAIAGALADGRSAGRANLYDGRSVYRKAVDTVQDYEMRYQASKSLTPTPENIQHRKQLEEIRLSMTVDANVKLLRSGFAVDTAPMEQTIRALHKVESGYAPIETCVDAMGRIRALPGMPAAAMGRLINLGSPLTVGGLYEEGTALQKVYAKAGQAYEAMSTKVRPDLGDSTVKALQNVDSVLKANGESLNDENRRAARIASDSQMDVNSDNLAKIRDADHLVQRVVDKMTPRAVLTMIKDGVDPLKTSMEDMESYLDDMDTYDDDCDSYAKFLRDMERSGEISPEQKNSFIGIYRMLAQIDKTGGEAVGLLVGSRAEITFKNLLSAVRTGKVRGVNVRLGEGLTEYETAFQKEVNPIDVQIESSYNDELVRIMRRVGGVNTEPVHLLKRLGEPITVEGLLASDALVKGRAKPLKKLLEVKKLVEATEDDSSDSEDTCKQVDEFFERVRGAFRDTKAYRDRQTFQSGYTNIYGNAEELSKKLTLSNGLGSVDVRAMQIATKQLHINSKLAVSAEEYDVPTVINGDLTEVHLKLVHDESSKGKFTVSTQTARFGRVSGEFTISGDTVTGYYSSRVERAMPTLDAACDRLAARLYAEGYAHVQIHTVSASALPTLTGGGEDVEAAGLYRASGLAIGALGEALALTPEEADEIYFAKIKRGA